MPANTHGSPRPQFSIGDSVCLKTGGKVMLVDDVLVFAGLYRYRCMWMDTDGAIQFQDFREDELDRVAT